MARETADAERRTGHVEEPREDAKTTTLDAPLVIEASGPAERRETLGHGVVETTEVTIDVEIEIATAEEAQQYHALHESGDQSRDALALALGIDAYDKYRIDPDEWNITIDGPVGAYRAAAEASPEPYTRYTRQCADCWLFGVGARIAELDARREADGDIDPNLEKFAEERGL